MEQKSNLVQFEEVLSIKVGNFIQSKGFFIADNLGACQELTELNSIGILFENPSKKPEKYCWGLREKLPRKDFIGIIWFNNKSKKTSQEEWLFEIYGRENIDQCISLAGHLAKKFNTDIMARLVKEETKEECIYNENELDF